MIRPLYCAGWSCTSTATYSQSFFAFFPCQHSVFSLSAHVLSFQSWPCLLIKLAKEEKNAHWHLLIKNTTEMGVLSSVQSKASKNIATLVLERTNQTSPWQGVEFRTSVVVQKKSAIKYFNLIMKNTHCDHETALVLKITLW